MVRKRRKPKGRLVYDFGGHRGLGRFGKMRKPRKVARKKRKVARKKRTVARKSYRRSKRLINLQRMAAVFG